MLAVDQLSGFGAASASGNDQFTKLLLHFDGADASTTFTDASPSQHGNGTVTGNTQVDTADSKFGGSSGLWDGSGDWMTFPNSVDWEFGTGDWTIDYWAKKATGATGRPVIIRELTPAFVGFMLGYSNGSTVDQFYASSNGSSWDIANAVSMGTFDTGAWHHYAVVRNGNNFYTFRDGTQVSTFSSSASLVASSAALSLGNYNNTTSYHGWLDELRVSKGIARWTSNFTPPIGPYF